MCDNKEFLSHNELIDLYNINCFLMRMAIPFIGEILLKKAKPEFQ